MSNVDRIARPPFDAAPTMPLSRLRTATRILLAGVMSLVANPAAAQSFAERADALLGAYHKAGLLTRTTRAFRCGSR